MRAVRVNEFGLDKPMVVEEVDDPKADPGEIIVKNHAAGINASDAFMRTGRHLIAYGKSKNDGERKSPLSVVEKLKRAFHVEPPYTPGHEAAGEVVDWANGVQGYQKGQRVFGRTLDGAYAEYVRMPAKGAIALPKPLGYAEGAGIIVNFYSAWNAVVRKAEVGPGERVLVHGGAGGTGSAAIQIAKRIGAVVFTTVSSKEKADFCKSIGADKTINYKEEDFAERCKELTGGRGVDAIIDPAATDNLDKDLDAIAVNGRIAVVGTGTGKGPKTEIRIAGIMAKDVRILGLVGANFYHLADEVTQRFMPLFEEGSVKVHVDKEFKFEEANEAHKVLLSGRFLGKLAIVP